MRLADILALPSLGFGERMNLPVEEGVYFAIINGDLIAYVGSTYNFRQRWRNHDKRLYLKELGDVRIHYIIARGSYVADLEQDAIEAFRPPLNRVPAIWQRRNDPGTFLPIAIHMLNKPPPPPPTSSD
jgi:hypothetical protein